jgi:hypothetical protein
MPNNTTASIIAGLQRVLDTLPSRSDEGDLTGMTSEHTELAGPRARATAVILDDNTDRDRFRGRECLNGSPYPDEPDPGQQRRRAHHHDQNRDEKR